MWTTSGQFFGALVFCFCPALLFFDLSIPYRLGQQLDRAEKDYRTPKSARADARTLYPIFGMPYSPYLSIAVQRAFSSSEYSVPFLRQYRTTPVRQMRRPDFRQIA